MRGRYVCLLTCGTLLAGANLRADNLLYIVNEGSGPGFASAAPFTNLPLSSVSYTDPTVLTPSQTVSVATANGNTNTESYSAYLSFGHDGLDVSVANSSAGLAAESESNRLDLISQDTLTVGGAPSGAVVRLPYLVDGSLAISGGYYLNDARFEYIVNGGSALLDDFNVGNNNNTYASYWNDVTGFTTGPAGPYFDSGYMYLPIANGLAAFTQELIGSVDCQSFGDTCSGSVSFDHTALVGGAVVLDSSGNVVQGAIITSASGHDYTQPIDLGSTSTVPEPAVWPVLAAVLVAGAMTRRKFDRART